MQPSVPTTLFANRYQFIRPLGGGGMGEVHLAHDYALRVPVALKLIKPEALRNPDAWSRFAVESQAMIRLQHPNVVRIFDAGSHFDGQRQLPYISMEFVDGWTLRRALETSGPAALGDCIQFAATLAMAVHYLHMNNIIHRDLKPDNIIIRSSDRQFKISDFGLAKLMDWNLGLTKGGMGTVGYMAPEQAMGRLDQIGPASDIYSLGVILYQLLTGRMPPVPEPLVLPDAVPPHVQLVCRICLDERPKQRFPTAAALAAELQRLLL